MGGSVRDEILNLEPKDYDFVVIKQSIDNMLKLGFKKVGRDFPVFLHPITNEEFALARKEISIGNGYNDFKFDISNVTLEEDLKRRDLTINAIAKDKNGNYIDPYNGIKDIKNKKLSHVSVAFKEDPVRIFRLARFLSRFPEFTIKKETFNFVKNMINNNEHLNITKERLWLETKKSLTENKPSKYFLFLNELNLLSFLFHSDILINKINNLDKLKLKLSKKIKNKELIVNNLIIYLIFDYTFKEIEIINKNFGNLPKDIMKTLNLFKLKNYKNKINSLSYHLKNKNYKEVINFYNSLNNMPLQKLKNIYLINKITNSKTQNKKLINEIDFIKIYIETNNINFDNNKFITNFKNKYNKEPEINIIKNEILKLKIKKLKKIKLIEKKLIENLL